jgi:hypothetical protein
MAASTKGPVPSEPGDEAAHYPESAAATAPPAGERLAAGVSRQARRRAAVTELELNFWSRALFYLMVGALHGLSIIPDFILLRLGVAGGFIGYLLDRRHVKIGMRNLAIAFPERGEAERRRILRASYLNLRRGVRTARWLLLQKPKAAGRLPALRLLAGTATAVPRQGSPDHERTLRKLRTAVGGACDVWQPD